MSLEIQPYNVIRDEGTVYQLWLKTLGKEWPLSLETFRAILTGSTYQEGDHWLAYLDHQPVGFVATLPQRHQATPPTEVGIACLFVDLLYQRRGIGRRLLEVACERLSNLGISRLHLGSGESYHKEV